MTKLTPYDPNSQDYKESHEGENKKGATYKVKKNSLDKTIDCFFIIATVLLVICFLCLLAPILQFLWIIIGGVLVLLMVVVALCTLGLLFFHDGFKGAFDKLTNSLNDTSLVDGIFGMVISYGQYLGIAAILLYVTSLLLVIRVGRQDHKAIFIADIVMLVVAVILTIFLLLMNYTNLFVK